MRRGFQGLAVFTSQFLFFGLFSLTQIGNSPLIEGAVENPSERAIDRALAEIRDVASATAFIRPAPCDRRQRSNGAS
jgi:hypothetical protein